MFQAALVTAFLVPASTPSLQDALLAKTLEDTQVTVYLGDISGRLAGENKGPFGTALQDPRVESVFEAIRTHLLEGEDGETWEAAVEPLAAALHGLDAAAFGIDYDGESIQLVLRGSEELGEALVAGLEALHASSFDEGTLDGPPYWVMEDEMESRVLLMESGPDWLLSAAEFGSGSEEELLAMLIEMHDAENTTPWWTEIAERPAAPACEVFLSGAGLIEVSEGDLDELDGHLGGFYLGFADGELGELSSVLAVTYEENDLMSALADSTGTPDFDLLKIAPRDAVGVGVLNFSLGETVDTFVRWIDSIEPGTYDAYQDGLLAAESAIGFSIEGDFFENFTGDFVVVSFPTSSDNLLPDEDDIGAAMEDFGVLVAYYGDSEPFLGVGELAESVLGSEIVVASSGGNYDGWTFHLDEDASFFVAVTDSALLCGLEDNVLSVLERLDAPDADGYATLADRKSIESGASGCSASLLDTAEILPLMRQVMEAVMLEDPEYEDGVDGRALEYMLGTFDALSDVVGETAFTDFLVSPSRLVLLGWTE